MLHRPAANGHGVRSEFQPLQHGVDDAFVFPTRNPAHRTWCATALQIAGPAAGEIPISVKRQTFLQRRHMAYELAAGGTTIGIFVGQIDKILLAEASLCSG